MTDIIDKILLNVTKMLTERKVLLEKNINKNYENLLKQKNEERIFSIKSDINQMHGNMFRTTNVLVNRGPIICIFGIKYFFIIVWVSIS